MEGQVFRHNLGLGVRKGAWSADEDLLLTRYINEHGEGNWHLILKRTGLNRCRKSCRLRWLNYLNPHIKRGTFAHDEIDLIVTLQKLLGNRWSLIASRITGRTANDVKNFWYTHLKNIQKSTSSNEKVDIVPKFDITGKVEVIKPQVRTFSKTLFSLKNKSVSVETHTNVIHDTFHQTKIAKYQNLSSGILLEHEQVNTSSICSLESQYNHVGANILNEDNSLQQRDDYWQKYLINSTGFNWETGFEADNVAHEEETHHQVNNDCDDTWENMNIWNL